MAQKRAHQPGFHLGKDSQGRNAWVKDSSSEDTKKKSITGQKMTEIGKEIIFLEDNFNPESCIEAGEGTYLSEDITIPIGHEQWGVEELDFHSGTLHMFLQSPGGNFYEVAHTPWLEEELSITPMKKVSEFNPEVRVTHQVDKISADAESIAKVFEGKAEESRIGYENDVANNWPFSRYSKEDEEMFNDSARDIREGILPNHMDIWDEISEENLTLKHWENMDSNSGRVFTLSSIVRLGDKEYVIQRLVSSDYDSSVGLGSPQVSINDGVVTISPGEGMSLHEVDEVGATVDIFTPL